MSLTLKDLTNVRLERRGDVWWLVADVGEAIVMEPTRGALAMATMDLLAKEVSRQVLQAMAERVDREAMEGLK